MKTPRQLLFERHRAAEPELDRIRQKTLAGLNQVLTPRSRPKPTAPTLREFVLSCRWHLAAMSAAWLVVLVLNVDRSPGHTVQLARENTAPPRQLLASLQAYQRQLIELLERPVTEPVAAPPRRSQLRPPWEVA